MLFIAVMVAIAINCAAENENVVENNATENTADVVLNDIDPVLNTSFYLNEERELFVIEIGTRFIRIKGFEKHQLVQTISKYLSEENGTWIEGANSVMQIAGKFYPAVKREIKGKGIIYCGAKHRQCIPLKMVKSVEKEFGIRL